MFTSPDSGTPWKLLFSQAALLLSAAQVRALPLVWDLQKLVSYRTDMCSQSRRMLSGEIKLDAALEGMHLNLVAFTNYAPLRFQEDASGRQSGLHMEVLRRVAQRGRFNFTVHAVDPSTLPGNWSWSEMLINQTKHFDIAMSEWLVTSDRMEQGVRCPYPFDGRTLVASKRRLASEEDRLFFDELTRWTQPFTAGLWLAFVCASVVTGATYYMLEHNYANHRDLGHPNRGPVPRIADSQYRGLASFTGAGYFVPKSGFGKLLVLTYSLLILLLVTAYTANLAATLVQTAQRVECQTFDSCIAQGLKVCVADRSAYYDWLLTSTYSFLARSPQLVKVQGSDTFKGLIDEACDIVLEDSETTEIAFLRQDVNPDCSLQKIDEQLMDLAGGWMGSTAFSAPCTSALVDALSVHFLRMEADGELRELRNWYYQQAATRSACPSTSSETTSLPQWTIESMSGGICIHIVCFIVVLAYAALRRWRPRTHLYCWAALGGRKYAERYARHFASALQHADEPAGAQTKRRQEEKNLQHSSGIQKIPEQIANLRRILDSMEQSWEANCSASSLSQRKRDLTISAKPAKESL
eukprot:CAMPEP_0178372342 /NCGR_PEP_ID=MMETSP0689_2-20121128/1301_1 /TAXON_ID=160604 /ORGANISM="Amphidinium massartii, Strain CS-259" /LENGTH=580 /DNA_ID=CAMNT_0019992257 /DNA_START=1 /DNA_END=1743 /DNA_ORIENTATION=-